MAEIEKMNKAAEIERLKKGSFLGDMYKVREIMIQRRKEKAEREAKEKQMGTSSGEKQVE